MQYEIEKKCETRLNFNVNLSQFSMSFCIGKQSQIAVDMYQHLRRFDIFFQREMTFFLHFFCIESRHNFTSSFNENSHCFSMCTVQYIPELVPYCSVAYFQILIGYFFNRYGNTVRYVFDYGYLVSISIVMYRESREIVHISRISNF